MGPSCSLSSVMSQSAALYAALAHNTAVATKVRFQEQPLKIQTRIKNPNCPLQENVNALKPNNYYAAPACFSTLYTFRSTDANRLHLRFNHAHLHAPCPSCPTPDTKLKPPAYAGGFSQCLYTRLSGRKSRYASSCGVNLMSRAAAFVVNCSSVWLEMRAKTFMGWFIT